MKRLIIHSEAEAELREGAAYYDLQRSGLGGEFRSAVEQTLAKLQSNPHLGSPYKRTRFRHYPMLRFPFVIYYAELPEALWIAALAQGSRRPGYWMKRRPEETT